MGLRQKNEGGLVGGRLEKARLGQRRQQRVVPVVGLVRVRLHLAAGSLVAGPVDPSGVVGLAPRSAGPDRTADLRAHDVPAPLGGLAQLAGLGQRQHGQLVGVPECVPQAQVHRERRLCLENVGQRCLGHHLAERMGPEGIRAAFILQKLGRASLRVCRARLQGLRQGGEWIHHLERLEAGLQEASVGRRRKGSLLVLECQVLFGGGGQPRSGESRRCARLEYRRPDRTGQVHRLEGHRVPRPLDRPPGAQVGPAPDGRRGARL
mmetsp:Transcript_45053/g.114241  ORF Transcript_45053/g.114241 Transcript_45053/m.114241 type:complete len:264 (+) Transcript_45053:117-908(+)